MYLDMLLLHCWMLLMMIEMKQNCLLKKLIMVILFYLKKMIFSFHIIICLDVKMRTTTNTSNHNSNVTAYKDYPASNSSTKSQTQLVCIKKKI